MAALEDATFLVGHRILTLTIAQAWRLLDNVEGTLGDAGIDREGCAVAQKVHGIVPPVALPDLAAIDRQDQVQLAAVKSHNGGDPGGGRAHRRVAHMHKRKTGFIAVPAALHPSDPPRGGDATPVS